MPARPEPHAAFLEGRIGSLEGLRGVAILLVVGYHAGAHAGLLFERGLGVNLFFSISGFLITSVLLREEDRRGQIDLGGFWIRRVLRTFPLYYGALALFTALVVLLERDTHAGHQFLHRLPAFLTFTANWVRGDGGPHTIFASAWSLSAQEQFYLLWGVALRFARPRVWLGVTALLLASAFIVVEDAVVLGQVPLSSGLGLAATMKAETLLLGGVAAIAAHHAASFRWVRAVAGHSWSSAALAAGLLAAALLGLHDAWVQVAAVGLVVACAIRPDHLLRPVLEWAPLRRLGTLSYALYLLHPLAIGACRHLPAGTPEAVRLGLTFSLAVAGAAIAQRTVEQPFLLLKERLGRRAAVARAVADAVPAATPPARTA